MSPTEPSLTVFSCSTSSSPPSQRLHDGWIPHGSRLWIGNRTDVRDMEAQPPSYFPLAMGFRILSLAMVVGLFTLFRRATYEDVEGHGAVRGESGDDVALARTVCRAGRRVTMVDGSARVDVHFYCGFWVSWHGLAKSAFAALGYPGYCLPS